MMAFAIHELNFNVFGPVTNEHTHTPTQTKVSALEIRNE